MTPMKLTSDRPLTLAEICQAIENGSVVADIENDSYVVRRRDLVRLSRQRPAAPARNPVTERRPLPMAS